MASMSNIWQQCLKYQYVFILVLLASCILFMMPHFVDLFQNQPKWWQKIETLVSPWKTYQDEQIPLDDPNLIAEEDILDQQLKMTEVSDKHTAQITSPRDQASIDDTNRYQKVLSPTRQLIAGRVSDNFYQSAKNLGLTLKQIQSIVLGLQWQVDLGQPNIHKAYLVVILEKPKAKFLQKVALEAKPWEVKSVLYRTNQKDYSIFADPMGGFYSQLGVAQTKSFNRLPLAKKAPISSGFNTKRHHPVTGQIAPHYGTDFAVPVGTPVYATSDGKVVKVGEHPLAGRYVVLKNSRAYSTRFLHLSQMNVTVGQYIHRGQQIGLSGNTGRTTGPHLHFELLKFGHPINAMTARLPQKQMMNNKKRKSFQSVVQIDLQKMSEVAQKYMPRKPQAQPSLFHPKEKPVLTQRRLFQNSAS